MKKIDLIKIIKTLIRKHGFHFYKYTLIGATASLLNIVFVWLLIDILNWKTIIASTIVVGLIFILKFYLYVIFSLIKKQFIKYALIQIISAILNIFFTWLFIEILLIPTIIATTLVVGGLFIGRFIMFKVSKLIRE